MIQAVVEVNVLVSALIGPLGSPRSVLAAWQRAQFDLITADGIIAELDEKLTLPRIVRRLPNPDLNRRWILELLRAEAHAVSVPPGECLVVTGDPEDDYVLAATRLSKARYLVTGDRKLLAIREYAEAEIVALREFIRALKSG